MNENYLNAAKFAFDKKDYLTSYDNYFRFGQDVGMEIVNDNLRICIKRYNKNINFDLIKLKDLKIAAIMDEFTYQNFMYECNIQLLTPQNWEKELENFAPNLLFVESAWMGKSGEWQGKINNVSVEIRDILKWFKVHNIPTAFWNKEDPVHFYDFLKTAALFDFIFTTDIEKIPVYKYKFKHERVYLLPFAAQPELHNPIEKYNRLDALCFAGSYYSKYSERCADLSNIIENFIGIKEIAIFDRYYNTQSINYKFPIKYERYIKGNLPFSQIDKAYKGYKYGLNINSFKNSLSFFARRVFELLGSNTLVISNFSKGIINFFGDMVFCSDDGKEILISLIRNDDKQIKKIKLCALRKIMQEHSYHHRLDFIAQKVLGRKPEDFINKLVVFSFPENENQMNKIISIFKKQSFNKKMLYIFIQNLNKGYDNYTKREDEIKIQKYEDLCNEPISQFVSDGVFLTVIDQKDWYGINYFNDLMLYASFLNKNRLGKGEYYEFENNNINLINFGKEYKNNSKFTLRNGIINSNCLNLSKKLYEFKKDIDKNFYGLSIDNLNYCKNAANINEDKLLKICGDNIQLNTGYSLKKINEKINGLKPCKEDFVIIKSWNLDNLFENITNQNKYISLIKEDKKLTIISTLNRDETCNLTKYHQSIYDLPKINIKDLYIWIIAEGNLNISYSFSFKDKNNSHLTWIGNCADGPNLLPIHPKSRYFNFSINILGQGISIIKNIVFGKLIMPQIKL